MKICVLGAGVIGVSTAYALARVGHEVVVIDKGPDVASGASHANGAQLSFSYVEPFASPTTLKALPKYLMGLDPALRLGLSFKPSYLKWGLNFLRNCTSAQFDKNLKVLATLSHESRKAFDLFDRELPAGALKRTANGKLVLISNPEMLERAKATSETYKYLGLEHQVLTKEACVLREPALKDMSLPFLGGVYSASDSALDPTLYCKSLKTATERLGGTFMFGETIKKVKVKEGRVSSVEISSKDIPCEAVVVCLGNGVNEIVNPHGISVPVYPVRGYSLTLPATQTSPKVSVTSLKEKVVFTHLGHSVRIAGFTDTNLSVKAVKKRAERLKALARDMWPTIADYDAVTHWTHCRPMTPSGVPIIGETKLHGLYLNAGHGALGYTFAAGSAMRMAKQFKMCDTHMSDIRDQNIAGDQKYAHS